MGSAMVMCDWGSLMSLVWITWVDNFHICLSMIRNWSNFHLHLPSTTVSDSTYLSLHHPIYQPQHCRELSEEFKDVGLMTGDVTINTNAACIVMTTEILRSMIYRCGCNLSPDYIGSYSFRCQLKQTTALSDRGTSDWMAFAL